MIAIYRDDIGSDTTLKKYMSNVEGAILHIGILKKFTSFGYESGYLMTVKYKSALNTSVIENL